MSKFTPWTDEEAEKAANEAENLAFQMSSYVEDDFKSGFIVGVAWAAERIEKCPTIHGGENNMGTLSWSPSKMNGDTHIAKLVGVREVNHE